MYEREVNRSIRSNQAASLIMIARYGGEEFTVLLPDTSSIEAMSIAERLRTYIEAMDVGQYNGQPLSSITISLGVTCNQAKDNLSTMIHNADTALYQAKQQGRNCLVHLV